MLNQSIREALTAELEFYVARRAKDEEKIKALRAILDPDDKLELFQFQLPIKTAPVAPPSSNGHGRLTGMGLRQAILTVLSSFPSGLKPAELVARLEQDGYKPGGRLTTAQLLYGELFRLKNLKAIERRRKRYHIPAKESAKEGGG